MDYFAEWLSLGDFADDAELFAQLVQSTLENLAHARPGFRATGWLPDDAHTLLDAVDEMDADPSEEMSDVAMTVVASALTFLHFLDENRLWTGTNEDMAHCVEDLVQFVDPPPPPILPGDIELPAVNEDDELRALTSLSVITTLCALVDWVGAGAAVTSTKVPKPAAVRGLADALGIDLDSSRFARAGQSIRSMRDVPEMLEFWEIAEEIGLITVNSTRAIRGPNAELISNRTILALPLIRAAVTAYVRSQLALTNRYLPELARVVEIIVTQTVLAGMTSEPSVVAAEDTTSDDEQSFVEAFVDDRLDKLVEQGWLTKDDAYRVPAALQPAVLRAVQLASPAKDSHVTLRISLENTHIPVWRSVRVDAAMPLAALHAVIQCAFEWEDSHLHEFSVGPAYSDGTVFVPADHIADSDLEGPAVAEEEVSIGSLLGSVGDELTYLYDLGDDWIHHIVVESVDKPDPDSPAALCLDGRNLAPYEDSGGPSGWANKIAAGADPHHPEHAEIREWLGQRPDQQLDPTSFNRVKINDALEALFG